LEAAGEFERVGMIDRQTEPRGRVVRKRVERRQGQQQQQTRQAEHQPHPLYGRPGGSLFTRVGLRFAHRFVRHAGGSALSNDRRVDSLGRSASFGKGRDAHSPNPWP